MQDKPFALIGVNINCYNPKKLKEVMDTAGAASPMGKLLTRC